MVKTTGRMFIPRCDDVLMWVISAGNNSRNTCFYSSVMICECLRAAVMCFRETSRGQATMCFPPGRSCVMWGAVQWRGRAKWKGSGSWTLSVYTLHHHHQPLPVIGSGSPQQRFTPKTSHLLHLCSFSKLVHARVSLEWRRSVTSAHVEKDCRIRV